ncbi:uncharacterized protein LOC124151025 isoform X2 [Haliotis rufescens]|uniref:uncharacterized protein LOC124151025 isoform X2 n=1 Tax=Haliotis rufescens TaxID=6454 RepID=UPI00201F99E4|nr:uncharacterized protein LOC124151025 isoform X2 [Haliotis rufescens]
MPRKDGCLALIILVAVHQASGSSIGDPTAAPRPCTEDEPMSAGSCWVIKCEGGYLSDFVTLRVSEECCQQPVHSDLCQSAYPVQSTTWYPSTMPTPIFTTLPPTTTTCPCHTMHHNHGICGQYAFCLDCFNNIQTLTVRDDSETLLCCTWTRSSRCLQLYPELLTTTPSNTTECQDSDTHINSDCYWMRCHDGKWQRPEPAMTEHCCSTYSPYMPERCAIGIYETEPIMTTTTSTPSPTTTTVTEPTTTLPTTTPCLCHTMHHYHGICGQYALCLDCFNNIQTLTVRDDSETLLCCTWTRSSRCLQLYPELLTTTPSNTTECQDSDTHINSDCYWMRCKDGKWQRPEPAITEHCCSTYSPYTPENCALGFYDTEPIMTTTTSTPSPTTTTVTEPTTTLPTTTPCLCHTMHHNHGICGQYAFCLDCFNNIQTLTVRDDSETLLCCTWTRSSRCLQLYPELLTTTPSNTTECQDSDTHINSDCYWMRCHDGKWQRPEPAMTEHCCSTYSPYMPERCAIGIYETEPIMTTTTSTLSPTTTTVTEPTTTTMCSGNGLLQQGYSHCWDLYCVSGNLATQPSLTLTCCEEFVMQNSPWSQDCYNTFPELYHPRCTSDEVNGCAYRKCSGGRLMDLVWAVISEYCCQPENRLDMAYSEGGCDVMFPPTTTEPSTTTTTTTATYPTSAMCSGNGLLQQGYSHCWDLYCVSGSWATQPSLTLTCCEEFVMHTSPWSQDCYNTFPELYHPRCTSDEVNGCAYRKCSGGRLMDLVWAVISEYCCQPENRLDMAYSEGGCDVMFPPTTTEPSTTTTTYSTTSAMCSGNGLLQQGYSHCWDLYCVSGSWATQPSLTFTCCEEFVMDNSPWSQDCYNTFPELHFPPCTTDEIGDSCTYRKCVGGRLMSLFYPVISEYCCRPENIAYQGFTNGYSDTTCEEMFPSTTTVVYTTAVTPSPTPADFTRDPSSGQMYPCTENEIQAGGCYEKMCVNRYLSDVLVPIYTMDCCSNVLNSHDECYVSFPGLYTSTSTTAATTTANVDVSDANALTGDLQLDDNGTASPACHHVLMMAVLLLYRLLA